MPFQPGNRAAVGHGRPRRIDRELKRMREAAEHARGVLETQALAAAMSDGDDPDLRSYFDRKIREGTAELGAIEAKLAGLAHLAEEIEEAGPAFKRGRRRRRRQAEEASQETRAPLVEIHRDEESEKIATIAVLLDRLVDHVDRRPN